MKHKETICINPKVNGKQPSLADRWYYWGGVFPCVTATYKPHVGVLEYEE